MDLKLRSVRLERRLINQTPSKEHDHASFLHGLRDYSCYPCSITLDSSEKGLFRPLPTGERKLCELGPEALWCEAKSLSLTFARTHRNSQSKVREWERYFYLTFPSPVFTSSSFPHHTATCFTLPTFWESSQIHYAREA